LGTLKLAAVVKELVLGFHNDTIPNIPEIFIRLVASVLCCKPHMMLLEQVIAIFELLTSNVRISLGNQSVNDILMIKLNGPPVAEVDLRGVVDNFLEKSRNNLPEVTKHMQQKYYNGFFGGVETKKNKIKNSSDAGFLDCLEDFESFTN